MKCNKVQLSQFCYRPDSYSLYLSKLLFAIFNKFYWKLKIMHFVAGMGKELEELVKFGVLPFWNEFNVFVGRFESCMEIGSLTIWGDHASW